MCVRAQPRGPLFVPIMMRVSLALLVWLWLPRDAERAAKRAKIEAKKPKRKSRWVGWAIEVFAALSDRYLNSHCLLRLAAACCGFLRFAACAHSPCV